MRKILRRFTLVVIVVYMSVLCKGHVYVNEEENIDHILEDTLGENDTHTDTHIPEPNNNVSYTENTVNTVSDITNDGRMWDKENSGPDDEMWIHLYKNDTESRLYLQARLKFILLNTGNYGKSKGFVVNTTLLPRAFDFSCSKTPNLEMIHCAIAFKANVSMYRVWRMVLKIYRSSSGTYYWASVGLFYFLPDSVTPSTSPPPLWAENDNLRKYETKVNSSYSCKSEDIFFLTDQVAVVIKDLKYRAFREINDHFPDEDIVHCPSEVWEFLGIAISLFIMVVLTVALVIRKYFSNRRCKRGTGYKNFDRRFEP